MNNISVVINTYNEAKVIKRAIDSVKWADEVLVCDMYSNDNTVEIAKKLGATIVFHKKIEYVEPARNFAISKAKNKWILVLDPDEEIPEMLKDILIEISSKDNVDFVRIPRKNIIFGYWMKASMWWPDLNIRLFQKGSVEWGNKIHRPPKTIGSGFDIESNEKFAITHYHYETIDEFIIRMLRYTKVQALELHEEGYEFQWSDLITKPVSEFSSRYFSNRGFEDGLHGLSLSILQSISFFVLYLKVWELQKFEKKQIELSQLRKISEKIEKEFDYWFKYSNLSKNPFKRLMQKVKNKL